MCVCVCTIVADYLQVMSDSVTPWTVALQAPLSMGFPRQEYCTGLPFLSTEGLPDPGIEPVSPALAGRFFWQIDRYLGLGFHVQVAHYSI